MMELCQVCGHEMEFDWDVNEGIWLACSFCDNETKVGNSKGDKPEIRHRMDRVHKNE